MDSKCIKHLLGCSQWMTAVKWPFSDNCCLACHTILAHISVREWKNDVFSVCCGVKALCLKTLNKKQYADALKMTFGEWLQEWGTVISDNIIITTTSDTTDPQEK